IGAVRNRHLALHRKELTVLYDVCVSLTKTHPVATARVKVSSDAERLGEGMIKDARLESSKILKSQIEQPVQSLIGIQDEVSKHEKGIEKCRFPGRCWSKEDCYRSKLHVTALNAAEILDTQFLEHFRLTMLWKRSFSCQMPS